MAKIVSLFIITFLTFSGHMLARPEPQFADVTPIEIHCKGDDQVEKAGGEAEDELLMRGTLEAHIDYIYTQKQKQP
ncbi:hypothetical protein SASPL_104581 [Salvia splendens]|uniref:Phytosulfokine n=1 Tax=Salvia splendens TaxID=180675 RepID=A0A8X8YN27_SALSN|nr:hypothetical protein SASPL_104581 [Salvia splendens]